MSERSDSVAAAEPPSLEGLESAAARRLLFAVIGLLQGLGYLVLDGGFEGRGAYVSALVLATLPAVFYFSYRLKDWLAVVLLAAAFGGLLAGLFLWADLRHSETRRDLERMVALSAAIGFAVTYIALPFFQTWLLQRRLRFPYPSLFAFAWNNGLMALTALLFLGAFWLVLVLWAQLFELLNIELFSDLFFSKTFGWLASGAAFGVGIALSREYDRIVLAARALVLALFAFLAPILAVAGLLFLAALPLSGLDPLWATNHATALILTLAVGLVMLANTLVRDGQDHARAPAMLWPVTLILALLPLFVAIAFYGLWLRIEQHGLTPQRFTAAIGIGLTALYALGYSGTVLWRRLSWPPAVARLNPGFAIIVALTLLALQTPLADPFAWSARDQLARLRAGEADPAAFDYRHLRDKLGRPGREALAAIRAERGLPRRAEIDRQLAKLDQGLLRDRGPLTLPPGVDGTEPVWPTGREVPPALADLIAHNHYFGRPRCHDQGMDTCAFVFIDVLPQAGDEAVFLRARRDGDLIVLILARVGPDRAWRRIHQWRRIGIDLTALWSGFRAGAVRAVAPRHKDLEIGNLRLNTPISPR